MKKHECEHMQKCKDTHILSGYVSSCCFIPLQWCFSAVPLKLSRVVDQQLWFSYVPRTAAIFVPYYCHSCIGTYHIGSEKWIFITALIDMGWGKQNIKKDMRGGGGGQGHGRLWRSDQGIGTGCESALETRVGIWEVASHRHVDEQREWFDQQMSRQVKGARLDNGRPARRRW